MLLVVTGIKREGETQGKPMGFVNGYEMPDFCWWYNLEVDCDADQRMSCGLWWFNPDPQKCRDARKCPQHSDNDCEQGVMMPRILTEDFSLL